MRRRTRLAPALAIFAGLIVVAAVILHNLLAGTVLASVDVGPGYAPVSMAVDSGMGLVYVGKQDGSIMILSTRDGKVVHTIPTSAAQPRPVSVAVAASLGRTYVAQSYDMRGMPGNEVAILDARSGRLLFRRRMRNVAGFMAVDEPIKALFVATQTGISRLDAQTGRLLSSTWSNGPDALAVDRRTQHVFVPVGGNGSVTTLDARTGRILHTAQVSFNPYYIALDERISRAYVASGDGTLNLINTRTGRLIKATMLRRLSGGFGSIGIAVDATAGRVLICGGHYVYLLDARSARQVALVDLGSGIFSGDCGVAVDEGYHIAYVSSPGGFKAIDTRTGAVLSSQDAVALRGGEVAVVGASHHVVVGGPHFGPGTALAALRRAVNGLMRREFWVSSSADYTWSVSIVQAAR